MIITMNITPILSRGKGKSVKKRLFSFSLRKKVIDRMDVLCYIMYYLSDERSIFVRIFAPENPPVHIQGGNALPLEGK